MATRALKPRTPQKPRWTPKQHAFVHWYCAAAVNMNGTEAARRAGYKGSDNTLAQVARENLSKPHIKAEVEKRLEKALSGADVTVEAVLRRLSVIGDKALEAEQYASAARCAELHGKYLKMFTDRIEHVNSIEDVSTEELVRLFHEIVEAGGIDLAQLTAGDGAESGHLPDSAGTQTTH